MARAVDAAIKRTVRNARCAILAVPRVDPGVERLIMLLPPNNVYADPYITGLWCGVHGTPKALDKSVFLPHIYHRTAQITGKTRNQDGRIRLSRKDWLIRV